MRSYPPFPEGTEPGLGQIAYGDNRPTLAVPHPQKTPLVRGS